MSKSSSPYPEKFRRQMVALVRTGRPPEELSREFQPSGETIRNWVKQADVEIIEVKESLTPPVVGQAIVGADMVRMEYHAASVTPIIVVGRTDSAIEIVSGKRGIEVWAPERDASRGTP